MLLDEIPQPASPAAPRDDLADLTAMSAQLNSVTEALYLAYVNGFDMKDVGWGRIDEAGIDRLMAMRAAAIDIAQRTPYQARAKVSNLRSPLFARWSNRPATSRCPELWDTLVTRGFIRGHDGDIVPMTGILGISWIAEGYGPDDTPPGTAVVLKYGATRPAASEPFAPGC